MAACSCRASDYAAGLLCRKKVTEQSIRWRTAAFMETGRTTLVAGWSGPSSREEQLEAKGAELPQTLDQADLGGQSVEQAG